MEDDVSKYINKVVGYSVIYSSKDNPNLMVRTEWGRVETIYTGMEDSKPHLGTENIHTKEVIVVPLDCVHTVMSAHY